MIEADRSSYEFVECGLCSSKPGSPVLCKSCLHNRQTIHDLQDKLSENEGLLAKALSLLTAAQMRHWLSERNDYTE